MQNVIKWYIKCEWCSSTIGCAGCTILKLTSTLMASCQSGQETRLRCPVLSQWRRLCALAMQGSASVLSLHPAIFHRRSIEETQLCPALVFCSAGGPMDEQSEAWPWSSPGQQLPGSRVDSWPSLLILTTTLWTFLKNYSANGQKLKQVWSPWAFPVSFDSFRRSQLNLGGSISLHVDGMSMGTVSAPVQRNGFVQCSGLRAPFIHN